MVAKQPEGDQSRPDIGMNRPRSRPNLPDPVSKVVTFARADFPII
ncbi:MAG: hypothetical protein ACLQGP_27345 [Isosphaeraceae bacterium]